VSRAPGRKKLLFKRDGLIILVLDDCGFEEAEHIRLESWGKYFIFETRHRACIIPSSIFIGVTIVRRPANIFRKFEMAALAICYRSEDRYVRTVDLIEDKLPAVNLRNYVRSWLNSDVDLAYVGNFSDDPLLGNLSREKWFEVLEL